jgi:hypothetical protein
MSIAMTAFNAKLRRIKFSTSRKLDYYMPGEMSADNDWAMAGYDFMTVRFANLLPWWGDPTCEAIPMQDTPGLNVGYNFGSSHSVSFNMALCDGSIRSVSYSTDLMTHTASCQSLRWSDDRPKATVSKEGQG